MCALQMSFSAKHWDGLLAILACSDGALRQVVQRWPGIAELTVADVMQRLLCLKVSPMAVRKSSYKFGSVRMLSTLCCHPEDHEAPCSG